MDPKIGWYEIDTNYGGEPLYSLGIVDLSILHRVSIISLDVVCTAVDEIFKLFLLHLHIVRMM